MYLLYFDRDGEISLTKNIIEDVPRYAILSHTWGADDDEVTFNGLKTRSGKSKAGYAKIQFCGKQAREDDLHYFWVDTCCIDKTSSNELSEAITSMFRWYYNAEQCYVYLSDVLVSNNSNNPTQHTWEAAFRESRWFTRGWTLQELIAPRSVRFFSREEVCLGSKKTLEGQIHEIAQVPIAALRGTFLSHLAWMNGCVGRRNATPKGKRIRRIVYREFSMSLCLLYMVRGRTRLSGLERRSTNHRGPSLVWTSCHMPQKQSTIPGALGA